MSDLVRSRRGPAVSVPLLFLVTGWLLIQNMALLALGLGLGHARAIPAPVVIFRVMTGLVLKLATRHPFSASLVLVTAALVIYLGFDLLRGREAQDDNG